MSSGLLPSLIETGAGLVKKILGSTPIGGIASPIIDTGVKLLGNLAGSVRDDRKLPAPASPAGDRMESPSHVSTPGGTPAGRILLTPESKMDVANNRPVVMPLSGNLADDRVIPVVRRRRRRGAAGEKKRRTIRRYF